MLWGEKNATNTQKSIAEFPVLTWKFGAYNTQTASQIQQLRIDTELSHNNRQIFQTIKEKQQKKTNRNTVTTFNRTLIQKEQFTDFTARWTWQRGGYQDLSVKLPLGLLISAVIAY